MIDPLARIPEIEVASRARFHVDAVRGGALVASDRLRCVLDGLELADSVTIDAHKCFATTISCGMFITRHVSVISNSFHVASSYMSLNNPRVDPYVTTAQWSSLARVRNNALRPRTERRATLAYSVLACSENLK